MDTKAGDHHNLTGERFEVSLLASRLKRKTTEDAKRNIQPPLRKLNPNTNITTINSIIVPTIQAATEALGQHDTEKVNRAFADLLLLPTKLQVDEDIAEGQRKRKKGVNPFAEPVYDPVFDRFKKVDTYVKKNDLQKAMSQLLNPANPAPNDKNTINKLRALHPANTTAAPRDPLRASPEERMSVPTITTDTVNRVILALKKNKAAAHSGWTNELLKTTAKQPTGLTAITKLFNAMISSEHTAPAELLNFNICALAKKDNGVRPISINETLLNACSSALIKTIQPKINTTIGKHQHAFRSNGTNIAALIANLALGLSNDSVIQEEDLTNAYNKIDRNFVISQARKYFPEIVPYVLFVYNQPGTGFLAGVGILKSVAGVKQGCPLSTLLFCLANDNLLNNIAIQNTTSTIIAFADDTSAIDSPHNLNTIGDALEHNFASTGQTLNKSKRTTYSPGATETTMPNQIIGGYNKFGEMLGSEAIIAANNTKRLKEFINTTENIEVLGKYFPTSAYYLLLKCLKPEIDSFVMMNEVSGEFLKTINGHLLSIMRTILGNQTISWERVARKPSAGGLAFKRVTNTKRTNNEKLLNNPNNDHLLPTPTNLPSHASTEEILEARHTLLLSTYNRTNNTNATNLPPVPHEPDQQQISEDEETELQHSNSPFLTLASFVTSVDTYLQPEELIPAIRIHLGLQPTPNLNVANKLRDQHHTQLFRINMNIPSTITAPASLSPEHIQPFISSLHSHCNTAYSFAYVRDVINCLPSIYTPPPPPSPPRGMPPNYHIPSPPPPPPRGMPPDYHIPPPQPQTINNKSRNTNTPFTKNIVTNNESVNNPTASTADRVTTGDVTREHSNQRAYSPPFPSYGLTHKRKREAETEHERKKTREAEKENERKKTRERERR